MKELVYGSYVPDRQIQDLRQYERRYSALNKRIVHVEQCIEAVQSLIQEIDDPDELVKCAHTRTKNKHGLDVIRESLNGVVSQVDRDMLTLYVEELDLCRHQQEECQMQMARICEKCYNPELSLLITIPGIKTIAAMTILSELGNDLSSFKTSSNLVGRAGLRPRNDESAGRIKSRKIMHGNTFLRVILIQCA